jgi:ferredoxin
MTVAYVITDDCALCMVCVDECPNEAISEGDGKCDIDPEKCTECVGFYAQPKCAEVCPSDACVPDDDRKEDRDTLVARYAALHPGRAPTED